MAALAVLLAAAGAPLALGLVRFNALPPTPPTAWAMDGLPTFHPDTVSGREQTASPVALPRSVPERLDIPAIGVHTNLMRLGLNRDGTVEVPPLDNNAPAGWYRHSVTPGEIGSAVILGHVDSVRDGAAIFYRLGALEPGDRISVRRADRSAVTFVVDSVRLTPKTRFPTESVYGAAASPILHLVTCGGRFDRRHGSYRENLIVTASIRR